MSDHNERWRGKRGNKKRSFGGEFDSSERNRTRVWRRGDKAKPFKRNGGERDFGQGQ